MPNIGDNIKSDILGEHGKHAVQLYRALNRQHNKEGAISVVGNLFYKISGYKSVYFDVVKDNELVIVKGLLYQYSDDSMRDNLTSGVFNFRLPVDRYKKVIYLEDGDDIADMFPYLSKCISPKVLLSTPVFSRNRLIGVFIVYGTKKERMTPEFRNLVQVAAGEFTAVFSRIERRNPDLENMLNLTALENVFLHGPKQNGVGSVGLLQNIVFELPNVTGMKKCILALVDKDGKFLMPYSSDCHNIETGNINKEKMHFLNKFADNNNIAATVLKTKKPIIVHDTLTDPRCNNELAKRLGIYSAIVLPVLDTNNEPLGILCVHNEKYELFSKNRVQFLEIVARRIGLIIFNMDYIDDLKTWSKYDGLTNLLNRRAFEDTYRKLCKIHREGKERFSILMIDIDDFRSTNDTYGHQVGDKVLRGVARCIKQNILGKDIAARYGGEEIVVILRDVDKREARFVADRIRHSISVLSVDGVSVTVSIGISTFGTDSFDKNNLIYIADKRLYKAKRVGKNKVVG